MPYYNGNIVKETEVLVEKVQIWIEDYSELGHIKSWSGSFDLPEKHKFSFAHHSECEVQLVDGRKGKIIPNHLDGLTVSFQGSGLLE